MLHNTQILLLAFVTAFIFSPVLAALARRIGVVSGSSGVRWSHAPKPLSGGISIVLAVLASLLMTI